MKRLLFILTFSVIALQASAQCNPIFADTAYTTTMSPYDVLFMNQTAAPNPFQTSWYWTFSSGSPATSTSPDTVIVTFPGPGNYSVCLHMDDSAQPCQDSICDIINIPGTPLSLNTNSTSATCNSCNGSLTVNPTGGNAPYTYLWSNASTTQTISNLCAGGYTVTVTDNYGATKTIFAQVDTLLNFNVDVTANNPSPCLGDTVTLTANITGGGSFSYNWNTGATTPTIDVTSTGNYEVTVTEASGCLSIDSLFVDFEPMDISINKNDETCVNCCDGSATASVSSGSGNYSYAWSSSSTTATTTALCPGTYTLTVSDNVSGCVQTENTTIDAFPCYTISGFISQGLNTKVYLIEENSGFLTAADSATTDSSGYYAFNGICNGIYYVKGALLPTHSMYNSYLPTYYDTAALWSQANALVINNSSMSSANFSLLAGNNTGGPGFIGGLISQGANRGEGDPIVGAQMIVTDNADNLVAFTRSDLQGEYGISDLPLGDYKLFVDLLNKTSYPIVFSITEERTSFGGSDFLVFEESIKPQTPNGILDFKAKEIQIFPNPAVSEVSIQSDEVIEQITVYSILGQKLKSASPLKDRTALSVEDLASGQYIIKVKTTSNTEYHTLIKE